MRYNLEQPFPNRERAIFLLETLTYLKL